MDASRHAQMLVAGSHGHGELIGKLIDSVSAHYVYHAERPVVVVRHAAT